MDKRNKQIIIDVYRTVIIKLDEIVIMCICIVVNRSRTEVM